MTESADTGSQSRLRGLWRELFYIDLRSLALFRICMGLVIIADLVSRSRDLVAHYTELGVAPRVESPA